MAELQKLSAEFGDWSLALPLYRLGTGSRRALVVAGVHGWEHSGIRVAYELAERLTNLSLRGCVDILPIANPEAFGAETRETPSDGRNLGESFAGLTGNETASPTAVIACKILELAGGCNHLLDLHSAGEARYLAHALFIKQEDGSLAAAAGLPFALLRRRSREGALCGTLVQAARSMGVKALALELGGGIETFREDIELGVRSVLSLLARWGYLQKELLLPRTAPDKIYLRDERKFVRAGEEGAYYPGIEVGKMVEIGKRIGVWIPLGDFKPRATVAPESGTLVYSRIRCRSHKGDTLAMLLPVQRTKEAQEE